MFNKVIRSEKSIQIFKQLRRALGKDEKWPRRQARMEPKITPVPGGHEGDGDSG